MPPSPLNATKNKFYEEGIQSDSILYPKCREKNLPYNGWSIIIYLITEHTSIAIYIGFFEVCQILGLFCVDIPRLLLKASVGNESINHNRRHFTNCLTYQQCVRKSEGEKLVCSSKAITWIKWSPLGGHWWTQKPLVQGDSCYNENWRAQVDDAPLPELRGQGFPGGNHFSIQTCKMNSN